MMTPEEQIEALREQVKLYRFDYVTGLKQRHDFERDSRKKFKEKNYHLAMFDVDGLHAVNRQHGYAAGDALLRQVANDLRMNGGTVYRTGGDEFMVIYCDKANYSDVPNATGAIIDTIHVDTIEEAVNDLDVQIIKAKTAKGKRREDDEH